MKILGIDPGTTRIGYGLIESEGPRLLHYGVLEIAGASHLEKLENMRRAFTALLKKFTPAVAGVETIYFSKNRKTALAVAHARGVLLSLLLERKIPVREYSPSAVKLAVTGYGSADKAAVALLAKKILRSADFVGYDDASDAVAIAIATASLEAFARRVTDQQKNGDKRGLTSKNAPL